MDQLPAGIQHLTPRPREGRVQPQRSEGAAEDQERRSVGVESEVRGTLCPQGRPIEILDLAAKRHPHQSRPRQRRPLESNTHAGGTPRTESVGKPRSRVGLVDHEWDAGAPSGDVGGRRRVSAEPDDDIDLVPRDVFTDLGDRATSVLGNHDLHLLATAAGVRKPSKSDTLEEILRVASDG